MINMKKQQGAVLLVSMIFLFVITVIGVNAVNSSKTKTQTAGNNTSSMLVYNAAESTLAKSATHTDIKNLTDALPPYAGKFPVPSAYLPDENVSAGQVINSNADVSFIGAGQKCPIGINGMAISSTMKCKVWIIDAQSRLKSTSARDQHLLGIAIVQ